MLVVEHATKVYPGGVVACDDVSLEVDAGQVVGLLGPNGAGKTTLAHMAVGLVRPTAGRVRVDGRVVRLGARSVQSAISFMSQEALAFNDLSAREALVTFGRLRGLGAPGAAARAADLLVRLGLDALGGRPIAVLSGGERQRVALAAVAMVVTPVVVLDEPTASLDPQLRATAWTIVREMADAGAAVLLITHLVAEAAAVVDRVAVMSSGQVRLRGEVRSVVQALDDRVRVRVRCPPTTVPPAILPFALAAADGCVRLAVPPGQVADVLRWLASEGVAQHIEDLEIRQPSLEEVMQAWFERRP